MKRKWLAVGIILLFVGTCIIPAIAQDTEKQSLPSSRGNWLYVGGSGPGNYTKIQDAINASSDGDTVFVYDDSSPYYGHIEIRKRINLIGENAETTIIDGNGSYDVVFLDSNSPFATIQGFTIIHGQYGIRVWCNSTVSNNIITSNYQGGITIEGWYNTILDNIIASNIEWGILFFGGLYNTIKDNTICNNGIGIFHEMGHSNTVIGNNLSNNRNHSISLSAASHCVIEGNTIENMSLGVCSWTKIKRNNFIGHSLHVLCTNSFGISWDANYWDDWVGLKWNGSITRKLPKVLVVYIWFPSSLLQRWVYIPYLNFDWHPAQEPYDIGV